MAETRIREALELLDGGRRWWQGSFANGDDLCLLGALNVVWTGNPRQNPAHWRYSDQPIDDHCRDAETCFELIQSLYPGRGKGAEFNDCSDTSWPDVELVMEKAAIMREEACE